MQFRWRLIADIECGVLLQFGEFFETKISSLEISPQNDGYLQLEIKGDGDITLSLKGPQRARVGQ